MKTCTTCKKSKDLGGFHKNKGSNDGLYAICKECRVISSKRSREKHGESIRTKWREKHKINPERHRQNARRYQKENWEYRKAYKREWDKRNPEKVNLKTAKRYSQLKKATPKWLSPKQKLEIRWFYDTARELQWLSEEPLCVDHIEPLLGKYSNGLHVPWNLRITSLSENSRKGNKLVYPL